MVVLMDSVYKLDKRKMILGYSMFDSKLMIFIKSVTI